MAINTLYHLIADVQDNSDVLGIAEQHLTIADYMNYWFCGIACAEVSLASTTQLYNPMTGEWSSELIEEFDIPAKLFPKLVRSDTKLGPLMEDVSDEVGLQGLQTIATCSHDTGAAVAAVPAGPGDDWAYLSSGTWSLIGVELPNPLVNADVLANNFTNEAGFGGTTRFLKNIVGLWLLQESRRSWLRQGNELGYAELNRLAEDAEPFRSIINPNDMRFMSPPDMPAVIADYCRESGQVAPETPGQFARCIFESLSLLYAQTLDKIEQLTARTIAKLHIVGGGSQSKLLNQIAADATQRTVLAGPVEATVIHNVLIQAIAMGELQSLAELRQLVKTSFDVDTFIPKQTSAIKQARQRFSELTK